MRAEKIPFQMGVAQPLNFTQHAKYYFGYFINAALIWPAPKNFVACKCAHVKYVIV